MLHVIPFCKLKVLCVTLHSKLYSLQVCFITCLLLFTACVTLYSNNVFVQALFAIIFVASVLASALRVVLYACAV